MIQSTSMERKQPQNHRPMVYQNPRSEVKSRGVTKQKMNYSLSETSPIHHLPKQQKYPERHVLDPPQTVTHKPKVCYSENIEMSFPEGQLHKEIEASSPYQEKDTEQEYARPIGNHYRDCPDLK